MHRFIQNNWWPVLEPEFKKPYYQKLRKFLGYEYNHYLIHPDMHRIFEAFKLTPFDQVKVVILGQDPYHEPGQAIGLSFSVMPGVTIPPSLINIYKEMQSDLGLKPVQHGCLINWTQQGVMLLNTVLTVRNGQAFSHQGKGWENLTDVAIEKLSARKKPVVFILWGKAAQAKADLIDTRSNVILKSSHPSPFSANRGFFGSRPFSKTNEALKALGEKPIDWRLPAKMTMDDVKKIENKMEQ